MIRLASLLMFLAIAGPALAGGSAFSDPVLDANLETLFTPGRDLAEVKLAVDQMSDPAADVDSARAALDGLTASLRDMAAPARAGAEKLSALKRLIYEAGPWNGNRPFAYDLDDPLGKKPANRLLHNYLAHRRGNCVTMPVLFVILGKRIGLDLTLAEAPQHLLVKYTDEAGAVWNIEATSGGGFARDSHYRNELPMSDRAVEAGTYLRPLSDEENVAIIASDIAASDLRAGRFERAIVTASALQRRFPRSAYLMVIKGSAYAQLLRRDVIAKYKRESEMTPEVRAYADTLYAENLAAFAAAEVLGWTERDGLK